MNIADACEPSKRGASKRNKQEKAALLPQPPSQGAVPRTSSRYSANAMALSSNKRVGTNARAKARAGRYRKHKKKPSSMTSAAGGTDRDTAGAAAGAAGAAEPVVIDCKRCKINATGLGSTYHKGHDDGCPYKTKKTKGLSSSASVQPALTFHAVGNKANGSTDAQFSARSYLVGAPRPNVGAAAATTSSGKVIINPWHPRSGLFSKLTCPPGAVAVAKYLVSHIPQYRKGTTELVGGGEEGTANRCLRDDFVRAFPPGSCAFVIPSEDITLCPSPHYRAVEGMAIYIGRWDIQSPETPLVCPEVGCHGKIFVSETLPLCCLLCMHNYFIYLYTCTWRTMHGTLHVG